MGFSWQVSWIRRLLNELRDMKIHGITQAAAISSRIEARNKRTPRSDFMDFNFAGKLRLAFSNFHLASHVHKNWLSLVEARSKLKPKWRAKSEPITFQMVCLVCKWVYPSITPFSRFAVPFDSPNKTSLMSNVCGRELVSPRNWVTRFAFSPKQRAAVPFYYYQY